jgi:hypothetical protein
MRKVTLRIPTDAVVRLGVIERRFFDSNASLEVLHTFAAGDSVSQVVRIRRKGALPPTLEIERRRGELLGRYALRHFEVLDRDEASGEVTALITRRISGDLASLLREIGSEVVPARPFLVAPEATVVSLYASDSRLKAIYGMLADLGIPYAVESARAFRGERSPLAELTERQRGLLELAFRLGYYDSPARTSLDRLAKIAGVSRAAVSKTLRRAEAALLGALLGATEGAAKRTGTRK